jgi:hypothetical protein
VILWLNRYLFLIEIKARDKGESSIESWIKRRIIKGVDQIVHNFQRVEHHETIKLHNQHFHTYLDTEGLVQTIGLIILVCDETSDILPTSVVPDIYQKKIPIQVFLWNDLKRMTGEIDTIPDLLYYLIDRYNYLKKSKSDIPLNTELDVLGYYKIKSNKFPEKPVKFFESQFWDQYCIGMKNQIANRDAHNQSSIFINNLVNYLSRIHNIRQTKGRKLPIGIYPIWELSMLSRRERSYWGAHAVKALEHFKDLSRQSKHFAFKNVSTNNWSVFYFSKEENHEIETSLEKRMEYKLMIEIEENSFDNAVYGFGFKISEDFPPKLLSLSGTIFIGADELKGKYSKDDLKEARQHFKGEKNGQKTKIEEFPSYK